MATVKLTRPFKMLIGSVDSVAIKQWGAGYEGGKTLKVDTFTKQDYVASGHFVLIDTDGNFVPAPINDTKDAYEAIPADHTVAGVNSATIPTGEAMSAIMTQGVVNPEACEIKPTPEYIAAAAAAGLFLEFRAD